MQKRRLYKIDSEDQIQADFFSFLAVYQSRYEELAFIFAVPNGGYRSLTTAMRLKKTGTKSGVPDVFVPIVKGNKGGLWIEFKAEKGKLQDSQKIYIEFLERVGYAVCVCRSWTEAAQITIDYLGLDLKI